MSFNYLQNNHQLCTMPEYVMLAGYEYKHLNVNETNSYIHIIILIFHHTNPNNLLTCNPDHLSQLSFTVAVAVYGNSKDKPIIE